MDPEKRPSGFLNAIPSFGSRTVDSPNLSIKDKRYLLLVEKALASFDSLEEWADYIAFLSRLQKSLQLTSSLSSWIPQAPQIANKLSLCLSSQLPNGVHQKALSIYEAIFQFLTPEALSSELTIWLPGLLPLFSYCSIQVKPQLLKIYDNYLLAKVDSHHLKIVSRPFLLSLLPGLDDENSEIFQDCLSLVDSFKSKLGDDAHFWQSMFLCILNNPERRLGSLLWCTKRLPAFSSIKQKDGFRFSEEAQACLTPESGLLVRAFAASINTSTSFNPAGDIIVVRGFFDLLLNHIPMNSDVFCRTFSEKDRELLVMACCRVVLKKDMSLNRRLWNWFLGPDSSDGEIQNNLSRSNYFQQYGLDLLSSGLLKLIHEENTKTNIKVFKIASAVIMDKWEISHLITPRLLSPILESAFKASSRENDGTDSKEILSSARTFFDGVEACHIWNDITNNLILSEDSKLDTLEFLLKNFDFHEEEMINTHIPLSILACLTESNISHQQLKILNLLIDLIPGRALAIFDESQNKPVFKTADIVAMIRKYYSDLTLDETVKPPITSGATSFLIIDLLKDLFVKYFQDPEFAPIICKLFCELLYNFPNNEGIRYWSDRSLIDTVLDQKVTEINDPSESKQANLLVAFNIAKLLRYLSESITPQEKNKLLKIVLTNLWTSLVSKSPVNFQVETVKHIFDLSIIFPVSHIEAGILNLLLQSPRNDRVKAFSILWTHSVSFSDSDKILSRPLQLLLDDLYENDQQNALAATEFVRSVLKNGSSNRLLKLITNPLLNFDFMHSKNNTVTLKDDLKQFAYYLRMVLHTIKANEKQLREAFSSELAVIDSTDKIQLIKINDWDISTYKSLMLYITERFIKLRLSKEVLEDVKVLGHFYDAIAVSLELLSILITGNESYFSKEFHFLLEACSYYIDLSDQKPYEIELIERAFLKTVFEFLKMSENLKINLNLLHIEDEGKEPLLVRFLIQGITKAQSSILLESWFHLLTRSLYLFSDSVFSVILTLNDAVINKIEYYFKKISNFEEFTSLEDLESSFDILTSGLEDLLSISHSYLLTSKFKSSNEKSSTSSIAENGFFGNVIQGVFQIESPAIRTTEQNKLYSILLSFQDAVKVAFTIWRWADGKPQRPKDSMPMSERSLIFLSHKLKFRSKKLLESLMDLERQEVIETLIHIDQTSPEVIKILHVLDGGRSQVTVPPLLNSITTRAYPLILEEKDRSSLNITISIRDLTKFLLVYVASIDNDTITDVWDYVVLFIRDVVAHPTYFKVILPELLKVIMTLSLKLGASKSGEQRKNKKELSDLFIKTLNISLANRSAYTDSDSGSKVNDVDESNKTYSEDLLESVFSILEYFDDIIQDSDKVNLAINSIISSLITPQVKAKKIHNLSSTTIDLIDLIGKNTPNKAWKNLIFDIFMDDSFFVGDYQHFGTLKPILNNWIINDKEKLTELIARISPSAQSSASHIFIWNEKSEIESKIFTIKRISFLLMIQPVDYFLNSLESIFDRIEYSLSSSCPPAYRSEISILFRVVSLKFSELHLLPHWNTIIYELATVFSSIETRNLKELGSLNEDELGLVLNSCKLLDQLLLLKYDEFNLSEWLFVSSHANATTNGSKDLLVAIIDRISLKVDQVVSKESPIRITQPETNLQPLLMKTKSLKSIADLRNFFDSLPLISFERVYGLHDIDFASCEVAILEDLVI